MLALMMSNAASTELMLPSGDTVEVPSDVLDQVEQPNEFEIALRWAYKAGMISHADFLAGRDVAVASRAPAYVEVQYL